MATPWIEVNGFGSRAYTNALLELVEDGALDSETLLRDLLLHISEHDVEDFVRGNLRLRDEDNLPIIREADEDEEE
jgi:hypothetical protein